jgi:hypothetical protein
VPSSIRAVRWEAVPYPGAVETEPLAERDDLQRRLVPRSGIGTVEQADGEEAQPVQRDPRLWHERRLSLADL